MSFELQFRAVLAAADGVTSLLSAPGAIFPVTIPMETALPAIEYAVITVTTAPTFNTRGIARARVEVRCWGSTYDDAVNVRTAVTQALTGYSDATISVLHLTSSDSFDHESLQYCATAEFYVFAAI